MFTLILLALLSFSGVSAAKLSSAQLSSSSSSVDTSSAPELPMEIQLQEALKTIQQLQEQDSLKNQEYLSQLEAIKLRTKDSLVGAQIEKLNQEDSLRKMEIKLRVDSLRNQQSGFVVAPFAESDTVFILYAGVGNIEPQERVRLIETRIKNLAENPLLNLDSLQVRIKKDQREIIYQNKMIVQVTPQDEIWANTPIDTLSQQWLNQMVAKIEVYRESISLNRILLNTGMGVGVILAIAIMFYSINRVFNKLLLFLAKRRRKFINGVKIQNYELFSPEQHWSLYRKLVRVIRVLVQILCFYVTLPLIFALFPWTEGVADTLLHYIILPAKTVLKAVVSFLPNAATIVVIYLSAKYIVKSLKYFATEIESGKMKFHGFYPDWAFPTFNILRIFIYALVFVLIFPYLPGSNSPVFKGVSVFLGVLLSLGSTSFIGNIVAGLVVTYMRPFRIGDRIKIGDITGKVIQKNLLVTRIRTPQSEDITLPNSNVMSGHTTNFTTSAETEGLFIKVNLSIGYDVSHNKVKSLLLQATKETDGISYRPASFVLITALDDFYIVYELNASIRNTEIMPRIKSDLHSKILDLFNEANIEILSPHYRAEREGNATTIIPVDED